MVFTTTVVGTLVVDGDMLGREVTVGLADGCGPATVGGVVGARLIHLSALIPKHCSPGLEQDPEGQASALKQSDSAVS